MRCWIDTDVGDDPDDAIALLCAAAHPDVEIVGVSTVDGDVEWRAELARTLVPDVDVVAGRPPSDALAAADALLLIGPWTHGAELVTRGQLPRRVGAMGGTIRPVIHHGELRVVEHNVNRNPDAAARAARAAAATVDHSARRHRNDRVHSGRGARAGARRTAPRADAGALATGAG